MRRGRRVVVGCFLGRHVDHLPGEQFQRLFQVRLDVVDGPVRHVDVHPLGKQAHVGHLAQQFQ